MIGRKRPAENAFDNHPRVALGAVCCGDWTVGAALTTFNGLFCQVFYELRFAEFANDGAGFTRRGAIGTRIHGASIACPAPRSQDALRS